jgi:transposase
VLQRLAIHTKRGRDYLHSPDPDYVAKRALIERARQTAQHDPIHQVLLFGDECSIYRQPSLASAYEAAGHIQPLARRSYRRNSADRLLGVLDAVSGRVIARRLRQVTTRDLVRFFITLVQSYPEAERITLVLDNWPVHVHPDVLVALEPQVYPFAYHRPAHWSTDLSRQASTQFGTLQLPIQLLLLPSYASWLNPIEKLWRKLRQEVIHLHRWADDLPGQRAAVDAFLTQFADGSPTLLREVGLAPN